MVGGKSKNKKPEDSLATAMKRFNDSWEYAKQNWHSKWNRDIRLYDNERVHATYEGTTDTFVPMVFSTIETMVAALSNASPRFEFKSGNPMVKTDDKALNALIGEWWDEDQWDLAIEEGFRETLTTGMVANMFSWDYENERPHLESFAMRDAIVDPTIKKPADLQKPGSYAGRRYFVRKGALENIKIVDTDPESKTYGELIPRYKITGTKDGGPSGEPDDKATKEMFDGSTLPSAEKDQDEVIEIVDVDRQVTILNRSEVNEDIVNPFKYQHEMKLLKKYTDAGYEDAAERAKAEAKGIVPYFFGRNYRKLSLFYATSEVNSIAKEQELLNDLTNMETDYIIKQLAPQKELDPKYADWIDMITNDPDVVYPFVPGSLVDRQVPVLPPNSFNNRMNIKNEIRETTAIDQVAKGVANVKDTTATEVRAQLNQSGQRVQSKARIFEKDYFYWMGWIVMKFVQLYVDKPIVVDVPGGSPISAEEALERYGIELPAGAGVFDPADFSEDFQVRVSLDIDQQNKEADQQRQAFESYTAIINDPSSAAGGINLAELKKRLWPKIFNLDQDDIDAILTPEQQPMPPMGAMPPEMMPGSELAGLGGEMAPVPQEVPGAI